MALDLSLLSAAHHTANPESRIRTVLCNTGAHWASVPGQGKTRQIAGVQV